MMLFIIIALSGYLFYSFSKDNRKKHKENTHFTKMETFSENHLSPSNPFTS